MDVINQVSERLATKSSRGGFIGTLGKAALGVAAFAAGQGLGRAHAAVVPDVTLACCSSIGCPQSFCPAGTHYAWNWQCCLSSNHFKYQCNDCYNDSDNSYNCTFPTHVCSNPFACPC